MQFECHLEPPLVVKPSPPSTPKQTQNMHSKVVQIIITCCYTEKSLFCDAAKLQLHLSKRTQEKHLASYHPTIEAFNDITQLIISYIYIYSHIYEQGIHVWCSISICAVYSTNPTPLPQLDQARRAGRAATPSLHRLKASTRERPRGGEGWEMGDQPSRRVR